jgi:hypothetical protein
MKFRSRLPIHDIEKRDIRDIGNTHLRAVKYQPCDHPNLSPSPQHAQPCDLSLVGETLPHVGVGGRQHCKYMN